VNLSKRFIDKALLDDGYDGEADVEVGCSGKLRLVKVDAVEKASDDAIDASTTRAVRKFIVLAVLSLSAGCFVVGLPCTCSLLWQLEAEGLAGSRRSSKHARHEPHNHLIPLAHTFLWVVKYTRAFSCYIASAWQLKEELTCFEDRGIYPDITHHLNLTKLLQIFLSTSQ
jgi:hypothetical protein